MTIAEFSSAIPPQLEVRTDPGARFPTTGTASLLAFLAPAASSDERAWTYLTQVIPLANGQRAVLGIPVEVRVAADYVAITEPGTAVHGVGQTMDAAFRDFRSAVFDHIELLSDLNLGVGLREQLGYLTYHLSRVDVGPDPSAQ